MIDGCNRLQAFYKIALPLALPGLISTALMSFIVAWDDYVLALTLISSDARRTLPVAMVGSFVGEFAVKWGEMMAVSMLMSLPVVVLFVFLQKYLIRGVTAGAVKGSVRLPEICFQTPSVPKASSTSILNAVCMGAACMEHRLLLDRCVAKFLYGRHGLSYTSSAAYLSRLFASITSGAVPPQRTRGAMKETVIMPMPISSEVSKYRWS